MEDEPEICRKTRCASQAGKKIRTKIDPELSRKLLSRITMMLFETQSALSRDRFKISKEVANATKDTDKETNQRRGG